MNRISLNDKEYNLEIDFNGICKLAEYGIDIYDRTSPFVLIRGIVALAVGDLEQAGDEIQRHIVNGGDFGKLAEETTACLEDSGFFQAMLQKTTLDAKPKVNSTKASAK